MSGNNIWGRKDMTVHAQGLTEIYKSVVYYNDAETTIPKVSGDFFKRGNAFQR